MFKNGQEVIYVPGNVKGYILEKREGTNQWTVLFGTSTFYIEETNLKGVN